VLCLDSSSLRRSQPSNHSDLPCSRPGSGPHTVLVSDPTSAVSSQDGNVPPSHPVATLTPCAFLTAHPPILTSSTRLTLSIPAPSPPCAHPTTAPVPSSSSSKRGRRPRSTRRSCTSTRALCTRLSVGESVSGAGSSFSGCATNRTRHRLLTPCSLSPSWRAHAQVSGPATLP
jgi:hypothetical protein